MRRLWLALIILTVLGCKKERKYDPEAEQEHADSRYLVAQLSQVCDGRAYPQAAAYERGNKNPKLMAVTISYGHNLHVNPYATKGGNQPTSLKEAQLVACAVGSEGSRRVTVRAVKDARVVADVKEGIGRNKGGLKDIIKAFKEGNPPPLPAPSSSASSAASGNARLKGK